MHDLRALLRSTSRPLAPKTGIAVAAGLFAGLAVGGALFGGHAALLCGIAAALLCLVATSGTLRIAVQNTVVIGLGVTGLIALAALTEDIAWLAAGCMAAVAFLATVIQSVPLVGPPLGSVGGLAYFIVATNSFAAGQSEIRVIAATLVALAIALIAAFAAGLADPRHDARALVAKTFLPGAVLSDHGQASTVLKLDHSPPGYAALLRCSALITLGRQQVELGEGESSADVRPALAEASACGSATAQVLLPRGRLLPRAVQPLVTDAVAAIAADPAVAPRARLGATQIRTGFSTVGQLLSGQLRVEASANPARPGVALAVARAIVHPDSASLRSGVRRALVLGAGMGIYKLLGGQQTDGFWVLLTIFLVMQPLTLATTGMALQRTIGTAAGIVAAIGLGTALPEGLVYPYVTVVLFALGITFAQHNPVVSSLFVAAFVTLMKGVPDHAVAEWGLRRLVATAIGALIAIAAVALIFPQRARPRHRIRVARDRLAVLADEVERASAAPVAEGQARPLPLDAAVSRADLAADQALKDLKSEQVLITDEAVRGPCEAARQQLTTCLNDLRALELLADAAPGHEHIADGLAMVRARLAAIAPDQ